MNYELLCHELPPFCLAFLIRWCRFCKIPLTMVDPTVDFTRDEVPTFLPSTDIIVLFAAFFPMLFFHDFTWTFYDTAFSATLNATVILNMYLLPIWRRSMEVSDDNWSRYIRLYFYSTISHIFLCSTIMHTREIKDA